MSVDFKNYDLTNPMGLLDSQPKQQFQVDPMQVQQAQNNFQMNPMEFQVDPMQVQQAQMKQAQEQQALMDRRQRAGSMMLALSDVLKGRDPSAGVMQRQKILQDSQEKRQAQEKLRKFENISKNIKRNQFNSSREYYSALGTEYLNSGFLDQGIQLLELGKPVTNEDFRRDTLSQMVQVEKQYKPVKDNVQNFQKLDIALNSDSGTGAYTALVFYLRNLDGSVVKSEEVNTFQEMQGFLKNIEQKYEKTKGEGMTDEVKAQLRNISSAATALTVEGYENYQSGARNTYQSLGLNPDLIFEPYQVDVSNIDLNKVDPDYFKKNILGTGGVVN
tara:strand:+ start:329 stop:1321 length:993 start_codon:yes stop_codon:yes gene_type:complete